LSPTIVNGYRVSPGINGVIVRYACETILENPGIQLGDFFHIIAKKAGVPAGDLSFLVIGGDAGPLDKLWRVIAEGGKRFMFPNEHTHQLTGSRQACKEFILNEASKNINRETERLGRPLQAGDLVTEGKKGSPKVGVMMGYAIPPSKQVFGSIDELQELPDDVNLAHSIRPVIMIDSKIMCSWWMQLTLVE